MPSPLGQEEAQTTSGPPDLEKTVSALLVKLGTWTEHDDQELPRIGYGFKPGMTGLELYTSARAWWRLDIKRVQRYPYAVAVHAGVTLAAWEIDPAGWRSWTEPTVGSGAMRWAFTGAPATNLAGASLVGRRVPRHRPDGRATFGSGNPIAYWPR